MTPNPLRGHGKLVRQQNLYADTPHEVRLTAKVRVFSWTPLKTLLFSLPSLFHPLEIYSVNFVVIRVPIKLQILWVLVWSLTGYVFMTLAKRNVGTSPSAWRPNLVWITVRQSNHKAKRYHRSPLLINVSFFCLSYSKIIRD